VWLLFALQESTAVGNTDKRENIGWSDLALSPHPSPWVRYCMYAYLRDLIPDEISRALSGAGVELLQSQNRTLRNLAQGHRALNRLQLVPRNGLCAYDRLYRGVTVYRLYPLIYSKYCLCTIPTSSQPNVDECRLKGTVHVRYPVLFAGCTSAVSLTSPRQPRAVTTCFALHYR
jgi:hypothetical protein